MQNKLDSILNIVQDVMFEFDEKGTYLNIWSKDESLLAKPKEVMLGMTIGDILPKEQTEFYLKMIQTVIETQEPMEIEYSIETPKGLVYFKGSILPLNHKGIKTTILYANDVTDHVTLKDKFAKQKHQIDAIIENIQGVVVQRKIDKDNKISFPFLHSNIKDLTGYSNFEIMDNPKLVEKLLHPEDIDDFKNALNLSKNTLTKLDWVGRIIAKDGQLKYIHNQSIPKVQEDESIVWDGTILDITELKNKEAEFEKKQQYINHQLKLASLGQLAAGMGHEINNPNSIIENALKKLKTNINNYTPERINILIDMAIEASSRIGNITKGLRIFSHPDSQQSEEFDLLTSIETTINMINELYLNQNIEINLEYDKTKQFTLSGNKGRIDQVLINLISNAKDAISGKELGKINIYLDRDDHFISIEIKDNGSGIDKEIQDKVFDHFFTTKEAGKGTGIGLSLTNSIVLEHQGTIKLSSSEQGTSFLVKLPIQKKEI